MIARIVSLRFRQRPDRPAHGLISDLEEPVCDLVDAHLLTRAHERVDLTLELQEQRARGLNVQRLVFVRTEYLGEVSGDQATKNQISVRDR
ncbi:hypothetical protein BC936DRAFT_149082 [Jimgerdemannia flammicorona]|uniref:Uncharacterized protein n=2 Tax=Jimgerdemannia flammicorona TaxID=994334 RepID=A0A433DK46_9FUNG|nr:hypothetical protein BC936DRAFT_149082 [Jimgerdemannia flammicorona]RUS34827.1 hypothetical protein BC938DRAFT_478353 [Jimgerdemannia flammicorona]